MNKPDAGQKLVAVYRARSEAEALVIKSLLGGYDIPCLLQSNAAPSVHIFTVDGMGEVRVLVWESVAADARKLIEGEGNV